MISIRSMQAVLTAAVCFGLAFGVGVQADTAVWKTAYYKRTFVGVDQTNWRGGVDATLLLRTPMAYGGTQAQVFGTGTYTQPVYMDGMYLVQGADNVGHTQGTQYPVTFGGSSTLIIAAGNVSTQSSDIVALPVTAGSWYLSNRYGNGDGGNGYMPYAYDVDNEYSLAGTTLTPYGGIRSGISNRIDVYTTDTRPSIVCYGDSITAGYASTPNTGNRYPELLASRIGQPVLNLGVNGDVITQQGGSSNLIGSLKGVGSVIYLLGINDLIGGQITTASAYETIAQGLITQNRAAGRKVYWGTILPATGYTNFTAADETLRQSINTWIRANSAGADGVIDFDAALRDPANLSKMLPSYQSGDWLHPSDAGYQAMAQVAAAAFAIPEPASLSLLALGGLALLRRQK